MMRMLRIDLAFCVLHAFLDLAFCVLHAFLDHGLVSFYPLAHIFSSATICMIVDVVYKYIAVVLEIFILV
jgi:hypothetical protein